MDASSRVRRLRKGVVGAKVVKAFPERWSVVRFWADCHLISVGVWKVWERHESIERVLCVKRPETSDTELWSRFNACSFGRLVIESEDNKLLETFKVSRTVRGHKKASSRLSRRLQPASISLLLVPSAL